MSNTLHTQVAEWIENDPDETTRAQLSDMVEKEQWDELEKLFSGFLTFGTAGLRAGLGPGPLRMNRVVVRKAATGIAQYALAGQKETSQPLKAVIGFDARYGSSDFAQDTAGIFTEFGIETYLFDRISPTPLLAYTSHAMDADIGIMVTASHNPATDNGYKVYLGGQLVHGVGSGAQIAPPLDEEISAFINKVMLPDIKVADSGWSSVPDLYRDEYIGRIVSRDHYSDIDPEARKDLSIVYTPVHGVGLETAERALRAVGFDAIFSVPEQADPDPDFPTSAFPNPELPQSLALSLAYAEKLNADIVIANDPDADRVAIAAPDAHGKWRPLSGNDIGMLLAHFLVDHQAIPEGSTLAGSVVSSRVLKSIAELHGYDWEQTLTGFKWIARCQNLGFGFEEAIGYCVDPEAVPDKDGISAAVTLALCAAELKKNNITISEHLAALQHKYGSYVNGSFSVQLEEDQKAADVMKRVMNNLPETIRGEGIITVTDMKNSYEGLPPTTGTVLDLSEGTRIIIRPSGTEPKIKVYYETQLEQVNGEAPLLTNPLAYDTQEDLVTALKNIMA